MINNPLQRMRERRHFVQQLTSLLLQKKKVLILDETSVNLWSANRIQKTWMKATTPVSRMVNSQRRCGINIFGAIGNFTPEIIHLAWRGTFPMGWKQFLILLREFKERQHIVDDVTLVLDNHPCHKDKSLSHLYTGFRLLFLPAYSSVLSSIETLWSLVKLEP